MEQRGSGCVLCGSGSDERPLIGFEYRGRRWAICSAHLPVLIHDPGQLAARLPGAETLPPSEHHD
jgi:hypothetical protein